MDYVPRILEDRLTDLAGTFGAIVLTGPRQAGKTTLLKHAAGSLCPDAEYFSFDTPSQVDVFRRDPDLFFANHPGPLILDEVQHAPDILPYIKQQIDRSPGRFRFFISGSQSFALMKGISESLAGRAAILDLWPFCAREIRRHSELAEVTGLLDALEHPERLEIWQGQVFQANDRDDVCPLMLSGGYPPSVLRTTDGIWLESYRRSYLERDVRGMGAVQDLGRFDRFLSLMAGRSGQVVNKAELGRSLQIDNKTVDHWLGLLEQGYQVLRLAPWFANTTKRLVRRPKFHFSDPGLGLHLQAIRDAEALLGAPHFGALFESFVVMEIRKLYGHAARSCDMYFWGVPQGPECDIVLSSAGRLVPIEIKHAASLRTQDVEGIRAFMNLYGSASPMGAVISLWPTVERIHDRVWNIPLGLLLSPGRG